MSETRLIDANALYREVKTECNPYGKPTIGFDDGKKVLELIDATPTIEAEPVRHGRWLCICEYEEFSEEMADYLCESCGYVISRLKNQKPKFCEGCSARMDATNTQEVIKNADDN